MKRQNENAPYWVMMRAYDKQTCEWGLEKANGSVRHAAALLGIHTSYLYNKVKDFDIDLKKFKKPKANGAADEA